MASETTYPSKLRYGSEWQPTPSSNAHIQKHRPKEALYVQETFSWFGAAERSRVAAGSGRISASGLKPDGPDSGDRWSGHGRGMPAELEWQLHSYCGQRIGLSINRRHLEAQRARWPRSAHYRHNLGGGELAKRHNTRNATSSDAGGEGCQARLEDVQVLGQ